MALVALAASSRAANSMANTSLDALSFGLLWRAQNIIHCDLRGQFAHVHQGAAAALHREFSASSVLGGSNHQGHELGDAFLRKAGR